MALLAGRGGRPLVRGLAVVLVAAALSVGSPAVSTPLSEAQVKAGLLYNFISFVEWPETPEPNVLVIGVFGADPVTAALQPVRGQTVGHRRIEVREVGGETDARRCHILFVPTSRDREAPALLAALRDVPVLTVGEHEQFTRLGGVIRVFPDRSRLRLEIDVTRAERLKLRISSRLLNLSRVVKDGHVVR